MQFRKVNRLWQIGAGIVALPIIATLFLWWRSDPEANMFVALFWLHLPLVMLHEFEEYVYPGGFKEFFNTHTFAAASRPQPNVPLDEPKVFLVNMVGWVLITAGAVLTDTVPWFAMMIVVCQCATNIVAHGVAFQLTHSGYNPGLATAILLFVPYFVVVFWISIDRSFLSPPEYALSALGGVALGLLLASSMKMTTRRFERKCSADRSRKGSPLAI